MTKAEKSELATYVKEFLSKGITHGIIVSRLIRLGYQKATIKKYIKAFTQENGTNTR